MNRMRVSAMIRLCAWAFIALLALAVLGQGMSRELSLFATSAGQEIKNPPALPDLPDAPVLRSERIETVNVSWVAGAVNVHFTDGDAIEYSEASNRTLKDDQKLYSKISGDTLSISFTRKNRLIGDLSKTLDLFIPRSSGLDALKIEAVSCAVNVDGADAQISKVNIEGVSGEIDLSGLNAREIRIETVSGDVSISGICDEFRIASVSGEARIDLLKMPESIQGSSVSGDLTITLPENDGFTAKLTSFSGEIHSDFDGAGDRKNIVYKDGDASIRMESVSGSITILRGSAAPEATRTPSVTAPEPVTQAEPEETMDSVSSGGRSF